jgi:ribokinase
MRILNFGSLNIDFVYSVSHIVQPGETIASRRLDLFSGGKGLNQTIALAKAGAAPAHAGMVGPDGGMLLDTLRSHGVDASLVRAVEERSGNAIIQVAADGQNSIVLFGGANRANTRDYVDSVLARFDAGDLLLLQNEINLMEYIIDAAAAKGMTIALNPAPFDDNLAACDLSKVNLFIVNEVEGEQLSGASAPDAILARVAEKYPAARVLLTLGKDGAMYRDAAGVVSCGIFATPVVDTTAAGDTFIGYFLTAVAEGRTPEQALRLASKASSITVSRPGAADSIPLREEVEKQI